MPPSRRAEQPAGEVDSDDGAALVAGEEAALSLEGTAGEMYSSVSPGSRPMSNGSWSGGISL
jgi:hypothetical protein